MNDIEVYKIAEKEKINIVNYKWKNAKAKIFEIENKYHIGMNNNSIDNAREEKQILTEELGHYYCNALYYIDTDKVVMDKCEYRAKKWAYNVLVPIQKLKEYIKNNIYNIFELAEIFSVDVKYMYECLNFYKDRGLLLEY